MITFIGTHHKHFDYEDFSLEGRVKVDHFDKIFTEGISEDTESFKDRVNGAVKDIPGFEGLEAEDIGRGIEPEAFDDIEDAEVIYLDQSLPTELLIELARYTATPQEVRDVYPFDNIEEQLIKGTDTRSDYIEFFRDLRDMAFRDDMGYSSYASLDEGNFERLLQFSAQHLDRDVDAWDLLDMDNSDGFTAGLDEYEITFEDYVNVFGEKRNEFQDKRDSHWYEQITSNMEEDEKILVVAGIQHALDYEGTVRELIQQDHRVSVSPYGRYSDDFNPF